MGTTKLILLDSLLQKMQNFLLPPPLKLIQSPTQSSSSLTASNPFSMHPGSLQRSQLVVHDPVKQHTTCQSLYTVCDFLIKHSNSVYQQFHLAATLNNKGLSDK